jgi:hypothetical protein
MVQALALFLRQHFGTPPPPSELQLPGGAGATAGGIIMANREVMVTACQRASHTIMGLLCGQVHNLAIQTGSTSGTQWQ